MYHIDCLLWIHHCPPHQIVLVVLAPDHRLDVARQLSVSEPHLECLQGYHQDLHRDLHRGFGDHTVMVVIETVGKADERRKVTGLSLWSRAPTMMTVKRTQIYVILMMKTMMKCSNLTHHIRFLKRPNTSRKGILKVMTYTKLFLLTKCTLYLMNRFTFKWTFFKIINCDI